MTDKELEQDAREFFNSLSPENNPIKSNPAEELTFSQMWAESRSSTNQFGFYSEVLNMLIEYYAGFNEDLISDCESIFSAEQSAVKAPTISEEKALELSKHSNPHVRIELAKKGLCPHILKDDPVMQVRLATLRSTGQYTDSYMTKGLEPEIVQEMLIQGVGTKFFEASKDEMIQHVIKEVSQYEDVLSAVANSDLDVIDKVIYSFEEIQYNDRKGDEEVANAIEYLSLNRQNAQPRFTVKTEQDKQYDEDLATTLKSAIDILIMAPETRFGTAVGATDDFRTVFILDEKGERQEFDTIELIPYLMEDYEAQRALEDKEQALESKKSSESEIESPGERVKIEVSLQGL